MDQSALLALAQCGGWATRAELRAFVGDRCIDTAVAMKVIHRVGRGQYTSAGFDTTRGAARALSAVISHRSAALLHGWSVRSEPTRPELTVHRTRKIASPRRRGCDIRWRDLPTGDVQENLLTAPIRTVVDCARDLPLVESLAVADSALRSGLLSAGELVEQVACLPRFGRSRAALVLTQASALAANPFESTLRALALEAVGPVFTPQAELAVAGHRIRPDLVSGSLRIVIEADSHEFHTQRAQLVRDCWRYDELTLDGWMLLRFSWEHVMHNEDWVRSTVARAVAVQRATGSSIPSGTQTA